MKLLLFKSKTCGTCKMFEPQIKKASEDTGIEYISIDVDEKETFHFYKDLMTIDLIEKFDIKKAGTLVILWNEMEENSPCTIIERPRSAADLIKMIKNIKETSE